MTTLRSREPLALRPEYEREAVETGVLGEIERPLSKWERITGLSWVRQCFILVALVAAWQGYALALGNALLFPTFVEMLAAFQAAVASGELLRRCAISMELLVMGYAAGVSIAMALTTLAMSSRLGMDLLGMLTAMLNPLPAIALLPLALLWFGLGNGSIVFVLIHSVMWVVALNTLSGFRSVPETLRMAGNNYGLKGVRFALQILIPAAFPSILAGLKVAWAFAWRTLIAAELVFGTSSGGGGLGYFIYERRNTLDVPSVFAGLFAVILIGLFVENVIFRIVENRTVRKWGTQR
jgi:NitT/TauT family transport system permease protein